MSVYAKGVIIFWNTPSYMPLRSDKGGSGEFGPVTIRPSGTFGEFGLLTGEF